MTRLQFLISLLISVFAMLPSAGFAAADFPALNVDIIHIQERFDAFEQNKYLASSLDDSDRGFLVSRWGLTNLADGHFTAMTGVLVDAGLAKKESSVRILKAIVSPNKRLLALQLAVADRYSAWQTCQVETTTMEPTEECLSAVVVMDISSQRIVRQVIYSARQRAFTTATDVQAVTNEPVKFVSTDPVFSADGSSLLVLAEGVNSKAIYVVADNLEKHRFELRDKLPANSDLHVIDAGDHVLVMSETAKSAILSRENFVKESEAEIETQSIDYSGDWLDSQFRVVASRKDLIVLHQSAFRTKSDKSIESRLVFLNPATGTFTAMPYRQFIGNGLNDVPESNLLFARTEGAKLLLTSESDENLCREIPKGETVGYSIDLGTLNAESAAKSVAKISCVASVRDIPGISEDGHLPEAVDSLGSEANLIRTNLEGKEFSLVLKKSTAQLYRSSESVSPGTKIILENKNTLFFVNVRDRAIFRVAKDDLKVVPPPTTTTTTLPPAPAPAPEAAAPSVEAAPEIAVPEQVAPAETEQEIPAGTEEAPEGQAVDQIDNAAPVGNN